MNEAWEKTLAEGLRWKTKKVDENSKVGETYWKYFVDPDMYYGWKELYDTFGLDDLKPHYKRMELGIRKLMRGNENQKKLLGEKELENALPSDSLKKKKKTLSKQRIW